MTQIMTKVCFIGLLFSVAPSWAHFQLGNYVGALEDGTSCGFRIEAVDFVDGQHHPLNERVRMTLHFLDHRVIEAQHLALVSAEQGTVRPKKEILTAYWTTNFGAEAVELIMNQDGPAQMVFMSDNYRFPQNSTRKICGGLQFLGQ